MSSTITMDSAGRIVLPKQLRERFRLEGGAKLRLETVGDHLEITPIEGEGEHQPVRRRGLLVIPSTGKECSAADAVREDRDARDAEGITRR